VPEIELEAVCSARIESSNAFAAKFGFNKSLTLDEFIVNTNINTILILGPNHVHFEHLKLAIEMTSVKRIYLEKPVCSTLEEELEMAQMAVSSGKTNTGRVSVSANGLGQRSHGLLEYRYIGKSPSL